MGYHRDVRRKVRKSGTYRAAEATQMRKELRTKPDVRSGVIVDETSGGSRLVMYEPGNKVRYSLVLTALGPFRKAGYVLGSGAGSLVCVTSYGRSMVLPEGETIHHHVVQERMRCSVFDAVVLAELLGWLTGEECTTVESFVQEMAG
jgi:hypothetical protein